MGIILAVVTIVIVAAATGLLPLKRAEESASFSSPSASPTPTPTLSPTILPTSKPREPKNSVSINIGTPQSTSSSSVNGRNINDYIYPNSHVNNKTDNSLDLTSTDSTDAIANWYKDKIKSQNMNVNTFVTTQVNDKVVDKLVGQRDSVSVNIEINKEPGESVVKMRVNL